MTSNSSQFQPSLTVAQARQEVGRALSQPDPDEQLRMVNLIREWAYAEQSDLGLDLSMTFLTSLECLCSVSGKRRYGFRLPPRFTNVSLVGCGDSHLSVHAHWRLPYDGVSRYARSHDLSLLDRGYKPLERDFTNCEPQAVRYQLDGSSETGAKLYIEGDTGEGSARILDYPIDATTRVTQDVFQSIDKMWVVGAQKGQLLVSEGTNGRVLARYPNPGPYYSREFELLGITWPCAPTSLLISGVCRYHPLVDDQDIVEFGHSLVWNSLANYVHMLNKAGRDANDRANMVVWLETAKSMIVKQSQVDDGATVHRFKRRPLRGARLTKERYHARR